MVTSDELKCGLCKGNLCVPPTYSCTSKKFICGVCYESKLYHPDEYREMMDAVVPQELYDEFVKNRKFRCSYTGCTNAEAFGELSLIHMKNCEHREFRCPLSAINKHYLPSHYRECDFRTKDTTIIFNHIQEKHPEIVIGNKIDSCDFFRRQHGLFVFEFNDAVSVIYIDKVSPNSLRVTCRQIKAEVTDKCVIEVHLGRKKEKYVINCSEYIGAPKAKGQKLLKYATIDNNPIYFSIIPKELEVEDVTSDTEDYLPPLGNERIPGRNFEDDDEEFQVV